MASSNQSSPFSRRISIRTELLLGFAFFIALNIATGAIGYLSLREYQIGVERTLEKAGRARELSLEAQNEFLLARESEAGFFSSWPVVGYASAAAEFLPQNQRHLASARQRLDEMETLLRGADDPGLRALLGPTDRLRVLLADYESAFTAVASRIEEYSRAPERSALDEEIRIGQGIFRRIAGEIDEIISDISVEAHAGEERAHAALFATQQQSLAALGTALLFALALAGGATFALTRRVIVPLSQLTRAAERIGRGDVEERLLLVGSVPREFALLADVLNTMTARLRESIESLEQRVAERSEENTRLLEAERARARRQAGLLRLGSDIAATLDETEVCRRVARGLRDELLDYELVGIYLIDEATHERVLVADSDSAIRSLEQRIAPGRGVSERAITSGKLSYTPDVSRDPAYVPGLSSGSEVDVPLIIDGKVIGVLLVESRSPNAFNRDDFEALTVVAGQTSLAIGRARHLAAERRRAAELDAVIQASLSLTASVELRPVLDSIVESALKLMQGPRDVHLFLHENDRLVFGSATWAGQRQEKIWRNPRPDGLTYRVARAAAVIVVPDVEADPMFADNPWHGAVVGVPLKIGNRVGGVMNFVYAEPRSFADDDLRVLRLLADQAALPLRTLDCSRA